MVHNLLPNRARVYLTYTLDFVPDSSPLAKRIRPVEDALARRRGRQRLSRLRRATAAAGANGRYTFPNDDPNAYGGGPARNQRVIARNGVLVQTAGHLHPAASTPT